MTTTMNWSNEQLHNLELAEDLMDTVIAIASGEIHKDGETEKEAVDQWKLIRSQVETERQALRIHDVDAVRMAITRYTGWSHQLLLQPG